MGIRIWQVSQGDKQSKSHTCPPSSQIRIPHVCPRVRGRHQSLTTALLAGTGTESFSTWRVSSHHHGEGSQTLPGLLIPSPLSDHSSAPIPSRRAGLPSPLPGSHLIRHLAPPFGQDELQVVKPVPNAPRSPLQSHGPRHRREQPWLSSGSQVTEEAWRRYLEIGALPRWGRQVFFF